jgi:hypothetical protein
MQKYEYLCVSIAGNGAATTKQLNEYGKEGWELVCVVAPTWHYFKRPLNE